MSLSVRMFAPFLAPSLRLFLTPVKRLVCLYHVRLPVCHVCVPKLTQKTSHENGQSSQTKPLPGWRRKTRSMQDSLNNVFSSDLLPLEVKWTCICAGKEVRFTRDEYVVRNPGCCFLDECPCCGCFGVAEVQLSIS